MAIKELEKKYNPKDFEKRLYKWWEEEGFFVTKVDHKKKPYTIVMPPPNITGQLHLGHAINNTIQDFLIRVKRMQGYEALWLPGEDHASIATEVRVESELLKQGVKKKEMGRDKFLEKVWEWSHFYRDRIKTQLKTMGFSCDFTKEAFTMDENLSKAVRKVFVKLYEDGLIYRGNRIVNWCPKCLTAISDAEIEYSEFDSKFYYVKYPLKDGDGFVQIATTRPETILGDVAVAVNPKDERYKHLIGKTLILPIIGREMPILCDDYVDMEFGTGAVKITPAHDPNDYLMGKRHDLPEINVLNEDGTINELGGNYQGLDRYVAREKIVEELKEKGFLVKIDPIKNNIGCHDRCSTVIEPLLSKQWFVKMKPLADPAIDVVKLDEVKFVPSRFEKTYFNWMENIQDWCISRQLWWGHRIPAWYCDDCNEITVSTEEVNECSKCHSKNIHQDEDVLDTWFSSALWPFSTLGWPEETEELKYFYPTDVLVTGYDIIFFWIARMVFSGLYNLNLKPFNTVLINGIIRDSQGRKMSKSLGNGVDPLDAIEDYGADALRFSLLTGTSPGADSRFFPERVEAARNFANKIWNASRFVMMNLDEDILNKYKDCREYSLADKWILSKCNSLIREVTQNIEKYEIGIALSKVYDFIWTMVCDWYIELSKISLYGDDEKGKGITLNVLKDVLIKSLQLLHPVMPFITEEIYIHLNAEFKSISISKWPEFKEEFQNIQAENDMNYIIEAVKAIRNLRTEMNVPNSRRSNLYIYVNDENSRNAFRDGNVYFTKLASCLNVEIVSDKKEGKEFVSIVTTGGELFLPLMDLIDSEKERERLNKEKEKLEFEIERAESKLSNEKFVKRAPKELVEEETLKLKKYKEMLSIIMDKLRV